METLQALTQYYGSYDEDNRLCTRYGMVEYLTTMRYIEKYLRPGMRILEIGAATGRYSHYFAQQGYQVDAVELVEHNIEIFKQNTKPGEKITITQGNAKDLRGFSDNTYAYRNQRSRAFIIYHDETPVGMGLYYDLPEMECYDLSQIFIDERYQGRGYGKAATRLVLDALKQDGKYNKVDLCYIEGNDAAMKLYEQFGFVEIDRDEDEIILELKL